MVGSAATPSFPIPFPSFPDFLLTSGIPFLAVPFRRRAALSSSSQAGILSKQRHRLRHRQASPPGGAIVFVAGGPSLQASHRLRHRQASISNLPFSIFHFRSSIFELPFPICHFRSSIFDPLPSIRSALFDLPSIGDICPICLPNLLPSPSPVSHQARCQPALPLPIAATAHSVSLPFVRLGFPFDFHSPTPLQRISAILIRFSSSLSLSFIVCAAYMFCFHLVQTAVDIVSEVGSWSSSGFR
ncbi:hypothetical protein ACLOJK_007295 [Asimina triloba]